ncbi:hypothetical protein [Rhodococcus sp. USK13]|nr:hypothetical protein [Rhodococcus sp. USK13]
MPMGQVITLTFTHDTPEHVFTALSASLDKLTQHAGESNHSDMEGS